MTTRITKKTYFATLIDIANAAAANGVALPEGMTYESLTEFINHEVELLDNKATAATKRAAEKRAEGDALRETVYNALNDTDFMTIDDIVAAIGDPDVTKNKVTARLTQLANAGKVEKTQVVVEAVAEGGKSRKVSAYKKMN